MKLRWSHCVLYVRDLDAMIEFYRDVLGFEVSDRGPMDPSQPAGVQLAFLSQVGSDHHQIAFAPVRGDGPSTTLDHIAFRVDSLEDVQEMAKRLEDDGRASELGPVNHGNAWSIYFRDPEGNRIEVFTDSPFHVRQPQIHGLDLSLDRASMRKATEEHFGGEPDFMPMDKWAADHKRRHGE